MHYFLNWYVILGTDLRTGIKDKLLDLSQLLGLIFISALYSAGQVLKRLGCMINATKNKGQRNRQQRNILIAKLKDWHDAEANVVFICDFFSHVTVYWWKTGSTLKSSWNGWWCKKGELLLEVGSMMWPKLMSSLSMFLVTWHLLVKNRFRLEVQLEWMMV